MRRSGVTTRNIDRAVQLLFDEGAIFVPNDDELKRDYPNLRGTDYHPYGRNKRDIIIIDGDYITVNTQTHFLVKFLNRMRREHHMAYQGKFLPINRLIRIQDFGITGYESTKEPHFWNDLNRWIGYLLLKLRLKWVHFTHKLK